MQNKDFCYYIDTDSLFIGLSEFFHVHGVGEYFESLDDKGKINMILEASEVLEDYINERTFNETQLQDYNSQVKDFKIQFEQETIAKTFLAVKKKKYAFWVVNEGGVNVRVDEDGKINGELAVKGLEIVRSDSSEAVRIRLRNIYEMIMRKAPEDELLKTIQKDTRELELVTPEEIAANISVNNITKYIGGDRPIKHTPWHVRGVYNYRTLLKELDLVNTYDDIHEGTKTKVAYLKQNRFNIDVISFVRWPKEFSKYLTIDHEKMVEKFFLKKIGFLLDPMNKMHLLTTSKSEMTMNNFFR